MGPHQYLRLRRLSLIRAALQHADPASTSVEAVARHYQFGEPGRFAMAYRKIFGESPSVTLGRPRHQ
jgi:AraC-like DNA-binding protein